jgi:outer membrane lipopolysaccharide assembly protein LptE/RlpB
MKTCLTWSWMLAAVLVLAACGNDSSANEHVPADPSYADQPGLTTFEGPAEPIQAEDEPQPEPEPEPVVPQSEVDYIAFEGGLRAYPERRVVEMDAWLLSDQTRPLEFLLVAPGGATHESLFASPARAEHLKRALEIIGLQEAAIKRQGRGHFERPLGDRIQIDVRFDHDETGEQYTAPVEKWLWDHSTQAHPEPVGWVFTGSYEKYDPDLNRSEFDADLRGNHIALWRDASCVIDNDRPSGARPDVYTPHFEADGIPRPRMGTRSYPAVVLIFRPFVEPATPEPEEDTEE